MLNGIKARVVVSLAATALLTDAAPSVANTYESFSRFYGTTDDGTSSRVFASDPCRTLPAATADRTVGEDGTLTGIAPESPDHMLYGIAVFASDGAAPLFDYGAENGGLPALNHFAPGAGGGTMDALAPSGSAVPSYEMTRGGGVGPIAIPQPVVGMQLFLGLAVVLLLRRPRRSASA